MPILPTWNAQPHALIGMLHAPPLPGSPRYGGSWQAVRDAVVADADALVGGGMDGLLLENFGDVPFFPGPVPPSTVASLAALGGEVVRRFPDVPLGINVLRNDGAAALSIAQAIGAQFIRVNILAGSRVTDQGLIEGRAHELLRLRRSLAATGVRILADVDVKHSVPLAVRPLEEEVAELIERAGADGLIVSGAGTGKVCDPEQVRRVRQFCGDFPVAIGSGVTAGNLADYVPLAEATIVGTSLRSNGVVDRGAVERFVAARNAATVRESANSDD